QGIITSIIGGFLASMFGGSNFQITGATGAFIVTIYGVVQAYGVEGLAITTVVAGGMLFLMGFLKMGTLIKFIPYPIIVGFTSGIAVTIFSSQMKDILGLRVGNLPADFIDKWKVCIDNIGSTDLWTLGATVITILLIIILSKISKKIPASLVALVLMTVVAMVLRNYCGISSIETIGDKFAISSEMPKLQHLELTFANISFLFSAAFTIALLGAIVSLLSATVADGISGQKHDPNKELMGQGVANLIAPFFGGIPATGAVARTVTNIRSGAKTPVSGLIHSVLLLLILVFLGGLTKYIPMAALAGILVIVSYNMSDWRIFRSLLKSPRGDVMVLLTTFFLTIIFGLTIAIEIGMLLAVMSFVRRINETTKISISTGVLPDDDNNDINSSEMDIILRDGIDVYEIEGAFSFGMANKFDAVTSTISKRPKVRIIRMRHVPFIDSTGIHNLQILVNSCHKEGIKVLLSGTNDSVYQTLENTKTIELIGTENIYNSIHEAIARAEKIVSKK
ncbi:MAG: SulP family inorganic anion transporter, partial [Rikenellaceae bacterium]